MPALGRDALLALTTLKTVSVPLPELGPDAMILRELTGRDLMTLQQRTGKSFEELGNIDFGAALDVVAWMLRYSWVDEDGACVLRDDDVERIINMPLSAMALIIGHVADPLMQLNGLTKDPVGDAQKN